MSPCGHLSGATDLARHTSIVAVSDQSSAKLPLPCPDCLTYLPNLVRKFLFRVHIALSYPPSPVGSLTVAHRPRLGSAPKSVQSKSLIGVLTFIIYFAFIGLLIIAI